MKWFLGFEQSKDINVTLQIFADEACSRPLEFIEVNQYGESYGQAGKVVISKWSMPVIPASGLTVPWG